MKRMKLYVSQRRTDIDTVRRAELLTAIIEKTREQYLKDTGEDVELEVVDNCEGLTENEDLLYIFDDCCEFGELNHSRWEEIKDKIRRWEV